MRSPIPSIRIKRILTEGFLVDSILYSLKIIRGEGRVGLLDWKELKLIVIFLVFVYSINKTKYNNIFNSFLDFENP